jgi:isoquinoline 1-oxidoreductase beta subunit
MSLPSTGGAPARINRRDFIGLVAGAGGLALAIQLPAAAAAAAAAADAAPPAVRNPAAFLQIGADDAILITTPSVELGQGAHTAMPMIIMEELGGDWSRLQVRDAAADKVYDNPMSHTQMTVGSFSVRGWYTQLRLIGAAAREMLVLTAATEWQVPVNECSVANSVIVHGPSGRQCTFGSVAARAAVLPVPQSPALKDPAAFGLIGTSPMRTEIASKVDGSAQYGIDVRLPGMLYAAVKTCPTLGGKLKSFDASAAQNLPGYHSTVALPDGVITIARTYWQARKALDKVSADYDPGALGGLDSAAISGMLHAALVAASPVVREDGDAPAAIKSAARVLESVYEVPYLAHACMEPMNCTARVDSSGAEVWCSTQAPQRAQAFAATILGVPPERVTVHSMLVGGGFGRRGEADFVAQAVTAAKAVGQPVKLVWSREEDIQHDYYRPAAAIRFRAGVDAEGRLLGLESNMVTGSAPNFIAGGIKGPPLFTQGVTDMNYLIPNFRVTGINRDIGIRWGFWRSVAHSHNPFMFESFIDELAHECKQDPYQFRRSMLQHPSAARQLGVLELLAEKSQWDQPLKPGVHRGIAAFGAYDSFVGAVVEVSVQAKVVTIHRIVSVVDCGVAIHPDNIRAQLQGGAVFGLTAALRGEITIDNGAVMQSNFHDYPMLKLAEMPVVECHIVPSSAPPGGIGEPGTAPIAPALANAIFAASGDRIRSLPLSRLGYSYAANRI